MTWIQIMIKVLKVNKSGNLAEVLKSELSTSSLFGGTFGRTGSEKYFEK